MATPAKINLKNIDYFKFKKFVVDGNRDDYASCSREVKALCDCVQTLTFRDEEFDMTTDRRRFEEIRLYYTQILASKRIEALDMRIKNGWWAESKSEGVCSANKFKAGALKVTLVAKTRDWFDRRGGQAQNMEQLGEQIEGPGVYVFKHREHQCFQFVGFADKIFSSCSEKLKAAFDGTLAEPIASLLVISMASDWDFYFIPTSQKDDPRVLQLLQNDIILKHDSIWPRGLNFKVTLNSLLDLSEFRKSCIRHHWPPECEITDKIDIDLVRLRKKLLEADREEKGNIKLQINGVSADESDGESMQKMSNGSEKCPIASSPSTPHKRNPVSPVSQNKPKPPSSPRQTRANLSTLTPPAKQSPGQRIAASTTAKTRTNSVSKSPSTRALPVNKNNLVSKIPNKSKLANQNLMCVSLDAARSQLVLGPSFSADMTSSLCVEDLERAGVLTDLSAADDVMKSEENETIPPVMKSPEVDGPQLGTLAPITPAISESNLTSKKRQLPTATDEQNVKASARTLLRQRALSAADVRKRTTTTAAATSSGDKLNGNKEVGKRPVSAKVLKKK